MMTSQYLPRSILKDSIGETPIYVLDVEKPPAHRPKEHLDNKNWEEAVSLSVFYSKAYVNQYYIIMEDVAIECMPKTFDKAPLSGDYHINVGIPWSIDKWILDETQKKIDKGIYDSQYISTDRSYIWIAESCIPEYTGLEDTPCFVYKSESEQTEPIGTLKEVCNLLKANLLGYGQFYIVVTDSGQLEYYLIGFQLVNTTPSQSFPKPTIKVSPPESIVTALRKLSLY